MMWPNPFNPYEGGPTVIEWLKQVCDKFNELLTVIKNVRELPAGGSHGQVPTPKEDGSGYEWVDQSGGGGGGDVTASGNNVFTGTNRFEGLTVLAETHVPTAKDDNDATNKLYVDTLVSNTKKTTVDEVNAHTDERVNALRVLPAGGTSGQVPTIAPDGSTVEWKTPDTSGGGSGGGGVKWVEVALTNGANTAGEVHLFYDKADNTHLKMVGYFTSSSNLQAVSFTLPDDNPLDYGHGVAAALPTSALNVRNSIYMTGVFFKGTSVTIESYTAMSSSYYRYVGTEFYVVTSAPQTDEGLPEPTGPTLPDPTDVPLPDPTLGE